MRSPWCTPAGSTAKNSCAPRSTVRTSSTRQSAVAAGRADRHRVGRERGHRAARVVVDAHHRSGCVRWRSGREQPRLGVEVVLHRRVEVEVVPRQVGEAADREVDAVDAPEAQRVAGHLHHHGVDALFDHQRQQGLQIGRLGGGQRARQVLARDPDADGADQARAPGRRPADRPPPDTWWWSCPTCRSPRSPAACCDGLP